MGRRTDKRTGPNLPADTDIDDVEDQDDDTHDDEDDAASDGEQEQAAGKREAKYRKQRNELRKQLRQAQQELAVLKDKDAGDPKADKRARRAQREAAEELAFVKAAAAEGIQDVEAAWKLCDRDLLTWEEDDDDGPQLDGIEDALEHVLDRYPYVASDRSRGRTEDDDDEDDDRVQPPRSSTSGKPTNGPRKGHKPLDRAYLATKYPALSRRPRRSPFG